MVMTRLVACVPYFFFVVVVADCGRRASSSTTATTSSARRSEGLIRPDGPKREGLARVAVRAANQERRREGGSSSGIRQARAPRPSWLVHPVAGTGGSPGRELEDGSDDPPDDGADAYRGYGVDDDEDDYHNGYLVGSDDDAARWCSPEDAREHYGDHYHLHEGIFQRSFGGHMCSCASMDHHMVDFECTSCVVCDGPICAMRNVSLWTAYDDRDGEDDLQDKAVSQTLSVCTKFVNDFQPFREVEICGIVRSPNAIADDNLNQTTVNYSVNGVLCTSTERITCTGTGVSSGFLVDCSNVGYRSAMNTCSGRGLNGPWKYLYELSNKQSNHRVKANPFLTIGLSYSYVYSLDNCPSYDSVVIIDSPKGSWVLSQLVLLASIVSIGSLYRTLS